MANNLATLFERIQHARVNSPETVKYLVTMPDGQVVNSGLFRDNTRDVLEELSDAQVIFHILEQRLEADSGDFSFHNQMFLKHAAAQFHKQLFGLVDLVLQIRSMLPEDYQKDCENIIGEVKRLETPPRDI